jgi:hypothetical protein
MTEDKLKKHCATFKVHRQRRESMAACGKAYADEVYLKKNDAPYPANILVYDTEESLVYWAGRASAKKADKAPAATVQEYIPTPIVSVMVVPVPGPSPTTTRRHATPGPVRTEPWAPETNGPTLPTPLLEVTPPAPTAPVAAEGTKGELIQQFEDFGAWIHDLPDCSGAATGGFLVNTEEKEPESKLKQLLEFMPEDMGPGPSAESTSETTSGDVGPGPSAEGSTAEGSTSETEVELETTSGDVGPGPSTEGSTSETEGELETT